MKAYVAPVNPLHANPYTAEELWWVDDAWDQDTLDLFVAMGNKDGDSLSASLEAQQFSRLMTISAVSNLPRVIPDGTWVADYYLGLDGLIPDPDGFRSWRQFPHLSKPVRLYLYLSGLTDWAGLPGSDMLDFARKFLLVTAELTDEDIQFLFVDGGATTGDAKETPRRFEVSSSLIGGGALLACDLESILRNHSLASSDLYPALVSAITTARTAAERAHANTKEEENLIQAVAENPVTSAEVLWMIVDSTEMGMEWAKAETQGESRKMLCAPEPTPSNRYSPSFTLTMAYLFKVIQYHPNFVIDTNHPLVEVAKRGTTSSIRGPGNALPTVKDIGLGRDASAVDVELRLFAFRAPKDKFVISEAKKLAFGGIEAVGVDYDRYYHVAFGLGRHFRTLNETKAMFDDGSADHIPMEWLAEIAS